MRTPLDRHKQDDRIARWKERLGGVALIASIAWLATNVVWSDDLDFYSSRGPVASVHGPWETQCSACHASFTPISSHSWGAPFLGDASVSSQRCQSCHEGAVHHAGQQPNLTCGSCHREHRGRDASLVNLPDRDCTQCHADLSKHETQEARKLKVLVHPGPHVLEEFAPVVTKFSKDAHPEFRSKKSDPGKLKFNHQLHLTAGMALGKDGGTLMTLGKISEPMRRRYRDRQTDKEDSAPVKLDCASCHVLDAGDMGVPARRDAGAYVLPIVYESHCQACHPLTVDRNLAIPHRLNPDEIHTLLENHFTTQAARGAPGFLEQKVARPLPGKMPELMPPAMRDAIARQVEQTEKDLYLSKRLCAECHHFEGKPIPQAIKPAEPPMLRIASTQVPSVWLRHAKFSHTAHRAVQCSECHKADQSVSATDVLIPGRDNCLQCHAPKTVAETPGARFNCTECHTYHNGDHAPQGVGAAKRTPAVRRDVDAFLRGR